MIVILDYGVGNLGSIYRMLRKLGADVAVSGDRQVVADASHLVLPGVGAFDHRMTSLERSGLRDELDRRVRAGVPLLGICLGLQMLGRRSDEGSADGLGWLDIETVRLPAADRLPVPHMGWTPVEVRRPVPLLAGLDAGPEFYFAHSFQVRPDRADDVVATSRYGAEFACVIARQNISGVQFHPEKSHSGGRRLFANFAGLA